MVDDADIFYGIDAIKGVYYMSVTNYIIELHVRPPFSTTDFYFATAPPSTGKLTPVTKLDSSLARNSAA